jgi:hypothetical protein
MAHAQKLTEEVKTLTVRVKELEATLQKHSKDPVTILGSDQASAISVTVSDYGNEEALCLGTGALSIGEEGHSRFHGDSAGSEVRRFNLILSGTAFHIRIHSTFKSYYQWVFVPPLLQSIE